MVIKVAIIGNYAPHYRMTLWSALAKTREIQYYFFAYSHQVEGIKTIPQEELVENNIKFTEIKNIFLKKIVIWQTGVIGISFDKNFTHFIFNGDMYCLSTWIGAVIVKLSGRKVTFWGHGLYGNESWLKKRIRIFFYKIPDYHLLYNNRGKQLLIQENFYSQDLYVVYNSLDFKLQKKIFNSFNPENLARRKFEVFYNYDNTIIYSGRLTKEKRIDLLIEALNILKTRGNIYNLVLVGDGPERKQIMEKVNKCQLDKVKFWGPCYNESILGELFGLADLTVSPGNVGLTAIHSLSYGTPVITHNDFSHQGPEYEIIEDGITGMFFERENSRSLADSIYTWFQNNPDSSIKRQRCRNNIDRFYNPDYQIAVFNELITGEKRM